MGRLCAHQKNRNQSNRHKSFNNKQQCHSDLTPFYTPNSTRSQTHHLVATQPNRQKWTGHLRHCEKYLSNSTTLYRGRSECYIPIFEMDKDGFGDKIYRKEVNS